MTREEALVSLRTTLDWLGDDVKVMKAEIDPIIEACAVAKSFDDGPVLVAENIKGYPHARYVAGLWSRRERIARLCGVEQFKDVKLKIAEGLKNPLPPKVVDSGPCQEVFIPASELDPHKLFPMVQHTHLDGGRFFGSGAHYISGKYADGGSQVAFYRMSFRGNDYASINMIPGGHGDLIAQRFYNEKIPCTVNIGPPPLVEFNAIGTVNAVVFPNGDEVGTAGRMMGRPVEIVKAKTVDAYAFAQSEWVIEGYIVPHERVWESAEAEALGKQGVTMLHPEWARYMGRAYRGRKFEVTAVTHRRDRPYYYVPKIGTIWQSSPFVAAAYYELAERMAPGLVQDVATYNAFLLWGGVVVQVKKRRRSDEGLQRNILSAYLALVRGLRLAVAVDEDVNIYQPEDVLWAMTTRVNPQSDIIFGAGGRGQSFQPLDRMSANEAQVSIGQGGMAMDATVPFTAKQHFERARYPVEEVNLTKWFTEREIAEIRAKQDAYVRYLGRTGLA